MKSIIEQATTFFNRVAGYVEQFQDAGHAPLFQHERFTRLDPTDWKQIEYFKDRDYAPQTRQILGLYSLTAKINNGFYDVYFEAGGDLLYSAMGKRGDPLISSIIHRFEEPCAKLQALTKKQLLIVFDDFCSGVPLKDLIGDMPDNSIAAQFLSAEQKYGFAEIRGLKSETPSEAKLFNQKINEWEFPQKFLGNPYQCYQYRDFEEQPAPAPQVA